MVVTRIYCNPERARASCKITRLSSHEDEKPYRHTVLNTSHHPQTRYKDLQLAVSFIPALPCDIPLRLLVSIFFFSISSVYVFSTKLN